MKSYAVLFGVLAVLSLCFVDGSIKPYIAKVGRIALVVFAVLFVVTESIYLMT